MGTATTTMRPATATAFLLLGLVSCASAGRIFILDDGEDDGVVHRVRRDAPPYGPPAPAPYHPAPHHGPTGQLQVGCATQGWCPVRKMSTSQNENHLHQRQKISPPEAKDICHSVSSY